MRSYAAFLLRPVAKWRTFDGLDRTPHQPESGNVA